MCVYVKNKNACIDQRQKQLFESIGGKSHVQCYCGQILVIPSNVLRAKIISVMQRVLLVLMGHNNKIIIIANAINTTYAVTSVVISGCVVDVTIHYPMTLSQLFFRHAPIMREIVIHRV